MTSPARPIVVTAAIVERDDCFLVTRRLEGTHLAGAWEFPGGKCEAGESHDACLRRELEEELGTQAIVEDLLLSTSYEYPGKLVQLHFYWCRLEGEPLPMLGQQMRWVPRDELRHLEFPAADAELIDLLTQNVPGSSTD